MNATAQDSGAAPVGVSVVIPVYNEAAVLNELISRCLTACATLEESWELVLVDDGSADESAKMLLAAVEQHPGQVVAVLLNRNYGQHAAVMAGLGQAEGEVVVTLDADLQNPPEEIPRLVARIRDGFDVVGSVRQDRRDTLFRRLASAVVNRAVQKTTGVMMHDYGCMLRAYRRPVVAAMLQCPERSTFIPVLANSFARRTTEIEVGHAERPAGDSKYSLWKLISLQFDLLTSMTTLPMRLLSVLGTVVAALGIGFGVFLLVLRLVYGATWAAEGVFTLFSVLFVFVGLQFIGMGIMGEYIGRIYQDVRGRPRFFIDQVVGKPARSGCRSTQN